MTTMLGVESAGRPMLLVGDEGGVTVYPVVLDEDDVMMKAGAR
ncbi:hypothetical protein [Microbacterium halophytorum]|nr:hypothetical protein [Microbacterium halophytorum]